jgi:hypothetical protein
MRATDWAHVANFGFVKSSQTDSDAIRERLSCAVAGAVQSLSKMRRTRGLGHYQPARATFWSR